MLQKQQLIIQHYKLGKSQREIHRTTGISRKTIRKYLQDYDKELNDTGGQDSVGIIKPPTYNTSSRSPSKMVAAVKQEILGCLHENEKKLSRGQAKQRMKAIDILSKRMVSTFGLDCCSTINNMDMTARAKAAGIKTPFLKWIFKAFQFSIM